MIIGEGWKVWIAYDTDRDREVMRIGRRAGPSSREYLCPDGRVVTLERGTLIPEEAIWNVPMETFQAIMDALWARGIRPEDRRHEEEAKLLREHLDFVKGTLATVLPRALRKRSE